MFFKDIIGQKNLLSRFINTVKENRVSHAWLMFGEEGTGSLPIALAFASYILCTNRLEDDACGTCASCRKTQKYIHPDMHFVFPVNKTREVDSDSVGSDDFISYWRSFISENPYGRLTQWYNHIDLDNKQGIISTDESKRLTSKLMLKSFESDYKIVIIWHPEKMNDQASNKILKLLEEPPAQTIFMLVAENPDMLLTTIRSRCIPVKIPRITDSDMIAALRERFGIEQGSAVEVARLAEGNYLKAIEMAGDPDEINFNFLKFRDLMRSCLKNSIPEIIGHAEELSALNREKQKSFLEYGLGTVRESLALHFNEPEIVHIQNREMEFTPRFAPFITGLNISGFNKELSRAVHDIERNGNGKIIFLDLGLKLAGLIKR
ncbi:MAG TPA: DNA polymerase III subunit [Bacteroidales bacterium]|nr:DNA polymerase III subunit [Bacteroidales bacterium]